MKKEKIIAIIESKEKNGKDIKEILREIVEENIVMYFFNDGSRNN